jgi:hypothetical protein
MYLFSLLQKKGICLFIAFSDFFLWWFLLVFIAVFMLKLIEKLVAPILKKHCFMVLLIF